MDPRYEELYKHFPEIDPRKKQRLNSAQPAFFPSGQFQPNFSKSRTLDLSTPQHPLWNPEESKPEESFREKFDREDERKKSERQDELVNAGIRGLGLVKSLRPSEKTMDKPTAEKAKLINASHIMDEDGLEAAEKYLKDNKLSKYRLDPELSTKEALVFEGPNGVEIAWRGTQATNVTDWKTNAAIAVGAEDLAPRMKRAVDLADSVTAKYGKIDHISGFSLGGKTALHVGQLREIPATVFNPHVGFADLANVKPSKETTIWRTSTDIPSTPLATGRIGDNVTVKSIAPIKSSFNPVDSHLLKNFTERPLVAPQHILDKISRDHENYAVKVKELDHYLSADEAIRSGKTFTEWVDGEHVNYGIDAVKSIDNPFLESWHRMGGTYTPEEASKFAREFTNVAIDTEPLPVKDTTKPKVVEPIEPIEPVELANPAFDYDRFVGVQPGTGVNPAFKYRPEDATIREDATVREILEFEPSKVPRKPTNTTRRIRVPEPPPSFPAKKYSQLRTKSFANAPVSDFGELLESNIGEISRLVDEFVPDTAQPRQEPLQPLTEGTQEFGSFLDTRLSEIERIMGEEFKPPEDPNASKMVEDFESILDRKFDAQEHTVGLTKAEKKAFFDGDDSFKKKMMSDYNDTFHEYSQGLDDHFTNIAEIHPSFTSKMKEAISPTNLAIGFGSGWLAKKGINLIDEDHRFGEFLDTGIEGALAGGIGAGAMSALGSASAIGFAPEVALGAAAYLTQNYADKGIRWFEEKLGAEKGGDFEEATASIGASAAAGALAGSFIPGFGTAAGAGLGALVGGASYLYNKFF